jgi:hypothetical protein
VHGVGGGPAPVAERLALGGTVPGDRGRGRSDPSVTLGRAERLVGGPGRRGGGARRGRRRAAGSPARAGRLQAVGGAVPHEPVGQLRHGGQLVAGPRRVPGAAGGGAPRALLGGGHVDGGRRRRPAAATPGGRRGRRRWWRRPGRPARSGSGGRRPWRALASPAGLRRSGTTAAGGGARARGRRRTGRRRSSPRAPGGGPRSRGLPRAGAGVAALGRPAVRPAGAALTTRADGTSHRFRWWPTHRRIRPPQVAFRARADNRFPVLTMASGCPRPTADPGHGPFFLQLPITTAT